MLLFGNQLILSTLQSKRDKGINYVIIWKSKELYSSILSPPYT